MNRRKQFRTVATRFDTLAVRYQATVCVADIFIWLRARPDRSRSDPRNTPLGRQGAGLTLAAGGTRAITTLAPGGRRDHPPEPPDHRSAPPDPFLSPCLGCLQADDPGPTIRHARRVL